MDIQINQTRIRSLCLLILTLSGIIFSACATQQSTEGEQISVKFRDLTSGTGLGLYRMLSSDSIKNRMNADPQLKIRPNRELIPERKRGQVVQRALIVLEK